MGYGDLRPVNLTSRIIAILFAIMGLTFTGILIASAAHAATFALAAHDAAARSRDGVSPSPGPSCPDRDRES